MSHGDKRVVYQLCGKLLFFMPQRLVSVPRLLLPDYKRELLTTKYRENREMKNSIRTIIKSLLAGALLSAIVVAGTGAAQAALISYSGGLTGNSTDPYPNPLQSPLSSDGSISLNLFNSSLGTLNSVTIDLSSLFTYGTRFENSSPNSASSVTKNISQRLMIGSLLDTDLVNYNRIWNVAKADGTVDYSGTSGFTTIESAGQTNYHATLIGPALASYIGSGNLLYGVYSNATFSGGFTGGNGSFLNTQQFVTNATVTYDYTPTPIPAAFWLLGSGLLGLAGLRKRRQ
jgi:hypothetical protein